MKTVVIDGVKYRPGRFEMHEDGGISIRVYPLPPKQKTIVQVAAEEFGGNLDEDEYRKCTYPATLAAFDYIEQRLQAIEKKLEGK
jgi:hypothetical protein